MNLEELNQLTNLNWQEKPKNEPKEYSAVFEYRGLRVCVEFSSYQYWKCELDEFFSCSQIYLSIDEKPIEEQKKEFLAKLDWWIDAKGD